MELVQVGALPPSVSLKALVQRLNAQRYVKFRDRGTEINPRELPRPPSDSYFYTENEVFPALEPIEGADFVIGITSLRIAPSIDATRPENEYFGIWKNEQVQLSPIHARKGLISTTLWRERYESRAYRSTEQYLAFMVLAFLGDVQLGGLTHPWCTGCLFDYNYDNESIVSSVKSARLCAFCGNVVAQKDSQLREAYEDILKTVRRPPTTEVVRFLQGSGLMSVFVFSIVLALAVGFAQSLISNLQAVAIAIPSCILVILVVIRQYQEHPVGELK